MGVRAPSTWCLKRISLGWEGEGKVVKKRKGAGGKICNKPLQVLAEKNLSRIGKELFRKLQKSSRVMADPCNRGQEGGRRIGNDFGGNQGNPFSARGASIGNSTAVLVRECAELVDRTRAWRGGGHASVWDYGTAPCPKVCAMHLSVGRASNQRPGLGRPGTERSILGRLPLPCTPEVRSRGPKPQGL